jgi:hypothetical protein
MMSGPHDPESVEYWRHVAEQAQAEAALYRGMVGQMQLALRQLTEIWEMGKEDVGAAYPALAQAFSQIRMMFAMAKARG